ncbi:UNVERIFIED_CONTAM: ribosomal L7/L12-like protein [Williamsia faeni]
MPAPKLQLASGMIDQKTTFALYRDGTFTTKGAFLTSMADRLVAFSFDTDSMRRKSTTGRGVAAVATGGLSLLAANNRGVVYVTVVGQRSGAKTYTSRNPSNMILSSIRTLQAAADNLLTSPAGVTATGVAASTFAASERFADGPYAALLGLPDFVREQIAEQLGQNRKILAIKTLQEASGMSLRDAKDIIESVQQLPAEDKRELLLGLPSVSDGDGGAVGGDGGSATGDSSTTPQLDTSIATQLKALADLHAAGALSDSEFKAAKARILS